MLPTLAKLWTLKRSPLWKAASRVIAEIANCPLLKAAVAREQQTSYCPRCGQRPDGDRRLDEARERILREIDYIPRRHELDYAIAYHLLKRKI